MTTPSAPPACRVLVCTHDRIGGRVQSCDRRGAQAVMDALRAEVAAGRLPARVEATTCFGHCTIGPNAKVVGGSLLHGLRAEDPEPVRRAVLALLADLPKAAE